MDELPQTKNPGRDRQDIEEQVYTGSPDSSVQVEASGTLSNMMDREDSNATFVKEPTDETLTPDNKVNRKFCCLR